MLAGENSGKIEEPRSTGQEVGSFFKTLGILLIIALILRASVVEAYKIPSGSMIPSLHIGDHILVNKLSYGLRVPIPAMTLPLPFSDISVYQYTTPTRGEIVVFTKPDDPRTLEDETKTNIIKRVIGIAGDTVEVKGTQVFINNQLQSESYARWEDNGPEHNNFGPAKVPDGTIFLLGDNRDASKDSRFWPNHFLEVERVKGRAFFIYWSWHNLSNIGILR